MKYRSTRNPGRTVSFKDAVMEGLAGDGGLYIPVSNPVLDMQAFSFPTAPDFKTVARVVAGLFAGEDIPGAVLDSLIEKAYPFEIPLLRIDERTSVLELFHGPTCAFKDVGARFMAQAMSFFNRGEDKPLKILVATSGDTGSAVGSAFHGIEGISVTILYPKGRISPLQEKQLSTFDGNVRSIAVEGNFDDCQKLVKTAFSDQDLRSSLRLSSANSINIARLVPQSFYYVWSSLALKGAKNAPLVVSVPSGNFGNLTAGLMAMKAGAPISRFIAATNSNHVVPDFLDSGEYLPRSSVATISNAMDVGAPSNFERMCSMFSWGGMRSAIRGYWLDDEGTRAAIRACKAETNYVLDPHGAVGWKAWMDARELPEYAGAQGIILETAHPSKFSEVVEPLLGEKIAVPERLAKVLALPDKAIPMDADYGALKAYLARAAT